MKFSHIELIPSILKPGRPSQFDGESFTVLEYVSKSAVKINECIKEFNEFIDEVVKTCSEHEIKTEEDMELFQRSIEQKFQDFIRVIELKYKSQDKAINDAIKYMKDNLTVFIEETLRNMYDNGELEEAIITAVGNLKAEFQSTVDYVNTTIENYNKTFNERAENMSNAMELLVNRVNAEIEDSEAAQQEARQAATAAYDAINALDLTVIELDGKTPGYTEDPTDYNGGIIG